MAGTPAITNTFSIKASGILDTIDLVAFIAAGRNGQDGKGKKPADEIRFYGIGNSHVPVKLRISGKTN